MNHNQAPALVSDIFGVLVTREKREFLARHTHPDDIDTVASLGSQHELGSISSDKYYEQIANLTDNVSPQECRNQMIAERTLNIELTNILLIYQAMGACSLHLLSNTGSDYKDYFSDRLESFDSITTSYETNITKPDPRIFSIAQRAIRETSSGAIVFIDDSAKNCEAAEEAGWQAIHYTNNTALQTALSETLR